MSRCISMEGEYSDHVFDGETFGSEFICSRCFVFDEDAAIAEIDRLRAGEQRVRALAADHDQGRGGCVCPLCAALDGAS